MDKTHQNISFSARLPGLVDLASQYGKIAYLFNTSDGLKALPLFKDESGKIFKPPEAQAIPFNILPAETIINCKYKNDHDLYQDIFKRLKDVSVLPSDKYYHLLTVFIFFTHLPETTIYFPYLWFFGLPERGKSRIIKAVINLCYRGLYTETLNEAYMFRFADNFQGTLGIDVYDLTGRAQQKGSFDLLLGRFEKGIKVPRVTAFDKGPFRDIVYYDIAGPMVLATNVEIPLQKGPDRL